MPHRVIQLTPFILSLAISTGGLTAQVSPARDVTDPAGPSFSTRSANHADLTPTLWPRIGLLSVSSAGLTYVLMQTLPRPSAPRSTRYSEQGLPIATAENTMRSRSSGASAVVAALATNYVLSRTRYAESSGTTKAFALLGATIGVVALRLVASSDLASDVGLGAATAIAVHTFRF